MVLQFYYLHFIINFLNSCKVIIWEKAIRLFLLLLINIIKKVPHSVRFLHSYYLEFLCDYCWKLNSVQSNIKDTRAKPLPDWLCGPLKNLHTSKLKPLNIRWLKTANPAHKKLPVKFDSVPQSKLQPSH